MKRYPGAGARYNREFAAAVARAKLAGRKTFRFRGNPYATADHVEGVLADMREKRYRLKMA